MSNKHRGEVTITLDGQSVLLRPTFAALVEFEDRAKTTVYQAMQALGDGRARLDLVVAAIYAGRRGAAPKDPTTWDETGEQVLRTGMPRLLPSIMAFLVAGLTGEDDLGNAPGAATTTT